MMFLHLHKSIWIFRVCSTHLNTIAMKGRLVQFQPLRAMAPPRALSSVALGTALS